MYVDYMFECYYICLYMFGYKKIKWINWISSLLTFLFLLLVGVIELGASCLLGKHSTAWGTPVVFLVLGCFRYGLSLLSS
jgi:hypothetical protein